MTAVAPFKIPSPAHVARVATRRAHTGVPGNGGKFDVHQRVEATVLPLGPIAPQPADIVGPHTIAGKQMAPSAHFLQTCTDKGFNPATVEATFANPTEVYPSRSHPGQIRITGNGLCLVGAVDGNRVRLITAYEDRVVTAPRPDQMNTAEGRRYADRFQHGLGRG